MAPATATVTATVTTQSPALWLHSLDERDDRTASGAPLALSPHNLYGVVGQREHGEMYPHRTETSGNHGGGLYGLTNAAPNRTIWSDHHRDSPYESRMNFAVADDTSSTASVATDSAFFGSVGQTRPYYASSGPTAPLFSMDAPPFSTNRHTTTTGNNLPPTPAPQRSFQTSSLALAAATAAAVASNRASSLPTPTSVSSSGTSIPGLVGASSGSTAPSTKEGSPNGPNLMVVDRVSGSSGSSLWPRIAFGHAASNSQLGLSSAATPPQPPRGTSSLALAAGAGGATSGAAAALPSPPPGFLSGSVRNSSEITHTSHDDSFNSAGKSNRRRTRGGRRNRTRRQNRESKSSDQNHFLDSSSASYTYEEEEMHSSGDKNCSVLPDYGGGANTSGAGMSLTSLTARAHQHMMNTSASPTTLDSDSRASSEAIRVLMKPQTSGSWPASQASTMQSKMSDFNGLGDADYSNHTITTSASSSNNQHEGQQRPILPHQRQQQHHYQQQSLVLLDDQLILGNQFDDDDEDEDDSTSWDGSHPSGLFATGSTSSNTASRQLDSLASSSTAAVGTNSSPRSKKRDWLLRMNRKLQEIPLGELDPSQVPLAAIMNAWAKTKSSQGAAMVEFWLKRAQQEYDAGNRRVVPTTKMYTMAGMCYVVVPVPS